MGIGDTPRILVLNKLDLVVDSPDEPLTRDVFDQIHVGEFNRIVTTSATLNWGIDELRGAIDAEVSAVDREPAVALRLD